MAKTVTDWVCKCGARLGEAGQDGNGVPRLRLYRHAVDGSGERPVLGDLTGKMRVTCDRCGAVKVWWPSGQALLALLDELNIEQLRKFVEAFSERWNKNWR